MNYNINLVLPIKCLLQQLRIGKHTPNGLVSVINSTPKRINERRKAFVNICIISFVEPYRNCTGSIVRPVFEFFRNSLKTKKTRARLFSCYFILHITCIVVDNDCQKNTDYNVLCCHTTRVHTKQFRCCNNY